MRWVAAMMASLRALVIASFAGSTSAPAQQPADADDAAWSNAQSSNTPDAYQRYLEQFPIGRHAEEAFRSIVERSVEAEQGTSSSTRGLGVEMY